jgi:cytidylate kinase
VSVRVVTIDGPAGAGKSSASRALAGRLGFAHIDTGAMYRAVGVLAHERGIPLDDDPKLAALLAAWRFELDAPTGTILVDGRDLSTVIRRPDAGELASRVSTRPIVRERLVALQRQLGAGGGVVMEGRDIGTVVFPDALVKLYLTASPDVRAGRRARELRAAGEAVDEAVLARELAARDRRDAERAHSPLRPAADAVVIDTSAIPLDAVVDAMEAIARPRLDARV